MLQVGLGNMNKLDIKTTTHFHRGGMNTNILVTNNTKETYNYNCGGTGGRVEYT